MLDGGVAMELNWREWISERNAAHERLDEILKRAEREQRDLTPEEAAEADRLERKLRELFSRLETVAFARSMDGEPREGWRPSGIVDVLRELAGLPTHRANTETRGLLASGSALISGYVAREFFDAVRAALVTGAAGVRTFQVDGNSANIPRVDSDPAVAWLAEGTQLAESDPAISAVTLTPRVLASLVRVSRVLLEDSPVAEEIVEATLRRAVAQELDRVVLRGSGTGAEPRGILNTTGIGSTALAAAPTNWDPLIDAASALREANFEPTAAIMHPSAATLFTKTKDTTGRYIEQPAPVPRVLTTTAMPVKTVLLGDFRQALLGIRSGFEARTVTLQERYADFLQVGFLIYSRADVAVVRAGAFHKVTWP
jgi:HK97 family phage major capsid protein